MPTPFFEVLPNYGKDAEPVVEVIEDWPILKGRGRDEPVPKLQGLKKKMEAAPKPPLRIIGK